MFIRFRTTHGAFANFIFDHGIVGGAGPSEFLACKYVSDIDQHKGDAKKAKNYEKCYEKFVHLYSDLKY